MLIIFASEYMYNIFGYIWLPDDNSYHFILTLASLDLHQGELISKIIWLIFVACFCFRIKAGKQEQAVLLVSQTYLQGWSGGFDVLRTTRIG